MAPAEPAALPDALAELALDLRWTWSHAADDLWRTIEPELWELTRNPWTILQDLAPATLATLSQEPAFRRELGRLVDDRRAYLAAPTWCATALPELAGERIAYFCMEFGLGEAVPLYAGGLGILAGDQLKAASDLGLPVVGVGILFQEGYFRQRLTADGWQDEAYPYNDPGSLPITPARTPDGARVRIGIELPGRRLWLRVWRARVGRVELYLLDTNDLANSAVDRGITSKLYGGGAETRLLQEIVLGIGGIRALHALGVAPSVVHLNEGHAAFAVLERAARFMTRADVSFEEAWWATRAGNVFTTHTPVAAGFDAFSPELFDKYFGERSEYLRSLRVSPRDVLALGRRDPSDAHEPFNMAYLAVRGSSAVNGVSALHAATSRRLFAPLFPRWPEVEVPVGHVTNGVHVPSWDSRAADALWTRACGKARWHGETESLCELMATVPDEDLWAMRTEERLELLGYVRRRLERQLAERGVGADAARVASRVLDPAILTIGFARRFADYKRPDLLLADPERLARLLLDPDRPMQLIIAGKAHPADERGKQMIATWMAFVNRPDVRERAVFLEDYDMVLAEQLVQGVDAWINAPRRPWEACGTSGMKVLVNGGLNVSVLDGWWAEAFTPEVGWSFGDPAAARSDEDDARDLYETLERRVVPEFYSRGGEPVPRRWLARVRASLSRRTPRFSATRMAQEYGTRLYAPAAAAHRRRAENDARGGRALAAWYRGLASRWSQLRFGAVEVTAVPGGREHRVTVHLGEVSADAVAVELFAEGRDGAPPERHLMARAGGGEVAPGAQRYVATVETTRDVGDYTPRVVPAHPDAIVPIEAPLVTWQR